MKKPRVYITSRSFGKYCKEALELVKSVAEVEQNPYSRVLKEDELFVAVKDVNGLIVGGDIINRGIIEHAKKLKIIARHGVGLSNIDLNAATENNVVVTYTPHANAESVADFTVGIILSMTRHISQAHFSTKQGGWEATRFMGDEIYEKTMGIIGMGDIGQRVARRVKGFNMRILTPNSHRSPATVRRARDVGAELVDMKTLLKESDIITLHVPLTDETRGMIGDKEFDLMKKTAYLINVARGPVVDEKALYNALKEGKIAGAATDVYSKEPPRADFPLFELDNIIVTPHIAAYTLEAMRRMDMMNAEDVIKFFRGEKPRYVANPEVLEKIWLK